MRQDRLSRRGFVAASGVALLGGHRARAAAESGTSNSAGDDLFRYSLNTSTIRGQKLGLEKEIDVAAEAGYNAIEPWVSTVQDYVKAGGKLADIRKRVEHRGLTVEGAISFSAWIVDDDARRAGALEQLKREMDMLAQIGGRRIAAPPVGANGNDAPILDLAKVAERYRAILDLGDSMGVTPALELWGPSKNLHRLGECIFVVVESGHPKACLLGDVYHIYKGGSDFTGLKMLSAGAMPVLHMNDYPADPPRDRIADKDRVMPGDGIAPLPQILASLRANGGPRVLSLELFSQAYWEKDPLEVARTGLAKMKAAVEESIGVA
ncbi:MAG TPA: sugar phosphate isomerase/epimerase family protein [Sedimentisphaerales bacterium]|jgi:sugar phosphate isomerase/epimerase|nr:sugar phosphate isomerase/epimerase family protein [Sedimentisphaerales bacterium]HNU28148.1 sugar phosphate isomerase/epimerase family protein [Sedimentisphaerales bacterium]